MNIQANRMLNDVVAILAQRDIAVKFICNDEEGIEIGELKDGRIILNTNARDELSLLFTIAHLFGHHCQFKNYNKYKHLIEMVEQNVPMQLSDDFKAEFWDYEKEAFGIGKSLMMEAFNINNNLDGLYQTFMITDFDHFWNYITTGTKQGVQEFNKLLRENYKKGIQYKNNLQELPIPLAAKEKVESKVSIN